MPTLYIGLPLEVPSGTHSPLDNKDLPIPLHRVITSYDHNSNEEEQRFSHLIFKFAACLLIDTISNLAIYVRETKKQEQGEES